MTWHIQRNDFRQPTGRRGRPDEPERASHFIILDERDTIIASVYWESAHPRSLKEAQAHAEEIARSHNARQRDEEQDGAIVYET